MTLDYTLDCTICTLEAEEETSMVFSSRAQHGY